MKIDRWLAILLGIAALLTFIVPSVNLVKALMRHDAPSLHAVFCVAAWIVALAASLPQYYVLEDEGVLVRQGWRKVFIPYPLLQAAKSVHQSWSAAVYSVDRILLTTCDGHEHLIAPKDGPGFMRELMSRSPHIVVTGDAQ
ncbi:MAG TPA: PH domain-containing protein [Bryobacteraceae bacterium]|nr:PH domain-containing protein [Bryobacteraceae bacterium]